MSVSDFLIL